jgi:hypothetical protein
VAAPGQNNVNAAAHLAQAGAIVAVHVPGALAMPKAHGYILSEILNGNVTPAKPDEVVEPALSGDLKAYATYAQPKRGFASWVAQECRDGVLYKRYKGALGLNDNHQGISKYTNQGGKFDILVVLAKTCMDDWPLEVWDPWPEAEMKHAMVPLMTEAQIGPHTALPGELKKDSRACWMERINFFHEQNVWIHRYPWSEGMLGRERTLDDIKIYCEGQNWGRYLRGGMTMVPPSIRQNVFLSLEMDCLPENMFIATASLSRVVDGALAVMFVQLGDLSLTEPPEEARWENLQTSEAKFICSRGPYELRWRFLQKYGEELTQMYLPGSPVNPLLDEPFPMTTVPRSIAHRFIPCAKTMAKNQPKQEAKPKVTGSARRRSLALQAMGVQVHVGQGAAPAAAFQAPPPPGALHLLYKAGGPPPRPPGAAQVLDPGAVDGKAPGPAGDGQAGEPEAKAGGDNVVEPKAPDPLVEHKAKAGDAQAEVPKAGDVKAAVVPQAVAPETADAKATAQTGKASAPEGKAGAPDLTSAAPKSEGPPPSPTGKAAGGAPVQTVKHGGTNQSATSKGKAS